MNPSNYSFISFPFLGVEVNPPRTLSLGPLTAHYYGLIIAIGLILAIGYACKRSEEFGLTEDHVLDGALWVTPFAICCARIYYVAFSWEDYAANPISALYIWEGGIAIYGGVIGAIVGMAVFSKIKKLKLTAVMDLILMKFPQRPMDWPSRNTMRIRSSTAVNFSFLILQNTAMPAMAPMTPP